MEISISLKTVPIFLVHFIYFSDIYFWVEFSQKVYYKNYYLGLNEIEKTTSTLFGLQYLVFLLIINDINPNLRVKVGDETNSYVHP